MLRTNTREVRNAVRNYVLQNTRGWESEPKNFEEAAGLIRRAWNDYKYPALRYKTLQEAFKEFATGLPLGTFDYYATGDTVKLVGDMLKETDQERSKYSDSEACDLLTSLIFREVNKVSPIEF